MVKPGPKPTWTPESMQEAVAAYVAGEAVDEIKRAYRIAQSSLYAGLEAAGVPRRGRNASRPTYQRNGTATNGHRPARELAVTVDQHDLVEAAAPITAPRGHLSTWEIHYTGILTVEAESIDLALAEARKLSSVRRIYTLKLLRQ